MTSEIVWTQIDEAPALATYSFLPIVQAFTKGTGVDVVTSDISLSGRVLSAFPERLTEAQRVPDNLAALGDRHEISLVDFGSTDGLAAWANCGLVSVRLIVAASGRTPSNA